MAHVSRRIVALFTGLSVALLAALFPLVGVTALPAGAEVLPPPNSAIDLPGDIDPSLGQPANPGQLRTTELNEQVLMDLEIIPDQPDVDGVVAGDDALVLVMEDGGTRAVLARYDGNVIENSHGLVGEDIGDSMLLDAWYGADGVWNSGDDVIFVIALGTLSSQPLIWAFDETLSPLDVAVPSAASSGRNSLEAVRYEAMRVDDATGSVYAVGTARDTRDVSGSVLAIVTKFSWDAGTATVSADHSFGHAEPDFETAPDGNIILQSNSQGLDTGERSEAHAVAIDGNGNVLVGGGYRDSATAGEESFSFVHRFTSTGAEDPSFNGDGIITWDDNIGDSAVGGDPSEFVVDLETVGGETFVYGNGIRVGAGAAGATCATAPGAAESRTDFLSLRRIDAAGNDVVSPAFHCPLGSLGIFTARYGDLEVLPSGDLLATFSHQFDPGYIANRMLRLDSQLALDPTFGPDETVRGMVTTFEPVSGFETSLQVLPIDVYGEGRILTGGTVNSNGGANYDAFLTRLFANAAPQVDVPFGPRSFLSTPAEVPIDALPLANTPAIRESDSYEDLKLIGLGLGNIDVTGLGLGNIDVTPLGLGNIDVTGLGLGNIDVIGLGLGNIDVTGLGLGNIDVIGLGLGNIDVTGLGLGNIDVTPLDQILLSEIDPAPLTWAELLPDLDAGLQTMTLGEAARLYPNADLLGRLTLAQIAGDGTILDQLLPWSLLTPGVTIGDFAPPSELTDPGDFPADAEPTWEQRIANALDAPNATGFPYIDGSGTKPFSETNLLELQLLGVPFDREGDAALPLQIVPLKQIYFGPDPTSAESQAKFDRLKHDLLPQQLLRHAFLRTSPLGNVGLETVPVLAEVIDCGSFGRCGDDLSDVTLYDASDHIRDDAQLWQLLDGSGPGIRPSENLDPQALKDADGLTLAEASLAFIDVPDSPFTNVRAADLGGYDDGIGDVSEIVELRYRGPLRSDARISVTLPDSAPIVPGDRPAGTVRVNFTDGADTAFADVAYQRDPVDNTIAFDVASAGLDASWRDGATDPFHSDDIEVVVAVVLKGAQTVGDVVVPEMTITQGDGLSSTYNDITVGASSPSITGNFDIDNAYDITANSLYLPHLGDGERSFFQLWDANGAGFAAGDIVEVFVGDLRVDTDVVVYQPVGAPEDAPLRPAPNADPLIPVPAEVRLSNSGSPLLGDVRDDIVFEELPVLEVGNERGTTAEIVTVRTTASGPLIVQVGGYLGEASRYPVTLTATVRSTDQVGACPSRAGDLLSHDTDPYGGADEAPIDDGVVRTLPNELASDTDALVLYPRRRAEDIFGAEAGAAPALPGGSLYELVTTLHPTAELIEIDLDPAVRAAYEAWDHNPCSIAHANDVVRKINALVDSLRDRPGADITSVTLVGDHDLVPFALVADSTQQHNESAYGANLSELDRTNPLRVAYLRGYIPTHSGYGDLSPERYLNRYLYVSDLAVGRLLETPDDWATTVDHFAEFDGELAPDTSLVAGYDFLSDSSTAIADLVSPNVTPDHQRLIDGWTAADLEDALAIGPAGDEGSVTPDLVVLNGHADFAELGAATGGGRTEASDLAALDFGGGIIHTMGCHSAVSVSDVTVANSVLDFAEVFAESGAASYAGQTTYGLGLEHTIGLTEALMLDYQVQMAHEPTIGEAFAAAQRSARGRLGAFGVFDEKAIAGANFYGLPFWEVAGLTPVEIEPIVLPDADGVSTVEVRPIFGAPVVTDDGRYYTATDGRYATPEDDHGDLLATVGQPILPSLTLPIADDAKDALVLDYTAIDEAGFDPNFSELVIDDASREAVGDPGGAVVFPNQPVAVNGNDLAAVVGSFITTGDDGRGIHRRFTSMDVEVFHNTLEDRLRPKVSKLTATREPGQFRFSIDASDASGIETVVILIEDPAANGVQRIDIPASTGQQAFSATYATATPAVRYSVQVKDTAGNVRGLWNKGALFSATTPPSGPDDPDDPPVPVTYTLDTEAVDPNSGWIQAAVITFDHGAEDTVQFQINDQSGGLVHPLTTYSTPITVDGPDGHLTVSWYASDGQTGTIPLSIDGSAPTGMLASPSGEYLLDEEVTASYSCDDNIAVVTCELTDENGTVIPDGGEVDTSTPGEHHLTLRATDAAGFVTSTSRTYAVRYDFGGFQSPIQMAEEGEPPVVNVVKSGRMIPAKWPMRNADGEPVRDVTIVETISTPRFDCSGMEEHELDLPDLPLAGLYYDYVNEEFHYNWKTEKSFKNQCRQLAITFDDGTTQRAYFRFK